MKKVEIIIDTEGNISMDAQGFHGPECAKLMAEIQEAVGNTTMTRRKPEYNITQAGRQRQTNGGG